MKNLELLVQFLKDEINSEVTYDYEQIVSHLRDYDEVFYDEEED